MVNDNPTKEFKPSRGLRQGNPIAQFLFLITAQGISGLVTKRPEKTCFRELK